MRQGEYGIEDTRIFLKQIEQRARWSLRIQKMTNFLRFLLTPIIAEKTPTMPSPTKIGKAEVVGSRIRIKK